MRERRIRRCACAAALATAAALLGAVPAHPEMYRCVDADGRLRFVDTPHACPGARPHVLRQQLAQESAAPASAPDLTAPGADAATGHAPALAPLLLTQAEVAPGWELVEEAPAHPEQDPDLVAWGVIAQLTRHYARDAAGEAQVCSIELWGFAGLEVARAAAAGFAFPGWEIHREGSVLVMTRGLCMPRQGVPRRGVFPDCRALAERVRARAAAAAGVSPGAPATTSGR